MSEAEELLKRRDVLRAELAAVEAQLDDCDCPGSGRCHGSLCWCDRCGDVTTICDAPGCCKHRCQSCDKIRPPEDGDFWSYVCDLCEPNDPPTFARPVLPGLFPLPDGPVIDKE
jgi:hypothetical protein